MPPLQGYIDIFNIFYKHSVPTGLKHRRSPCIPTLWKTKVWTIWLHFSSVGAVCL